VLSWLENVPKIRKVHALILSLVLLASLASIVLKHTGAQGQGNATNFVYTGTGSPVGSCTTGISYVDAATGFLWTCRSGSWQLPTKAILASAYTNATTGMTNIAGLSIPVGANQNYGVICYLVYQVSSSSTVAQFTITGPAAPTSIVYSAQFQTQSATPTYTEGQASTAFGTVQGASNITAATNFSLLMHIGLVNGANAGTMQLQAAAQVTGSVTVQPGSWCTVQ